MRVAVPAPAAPAPSAAAGSTEGTKKAVPAPQINPSTTMRIDLPSDATGQGKPPQVKPDLSPSSTINLKPILPKPPTAPGVAVGIPAAGTGGSAAKKDTSKIPLDAAVATPGAGGAKKPKTIRIKPASPSDAAAAGPPKDAKRETSRISLEAALGGDQDAPAAPRTIKLKRPSEAPTVKAKPKAMSQTAQLDVPADEAVSSPTQKKTIKVKRPSEKRVVAAPSVSRAPQPAEGVAAPVVAGPDSAHWSFITLAAASILVSFVLIYVLLAQTFGPSVDATSLTPLSYGAPGLDLQWPGKVTLH